MPTAHRYEFVCVCVLDVYFLPVRLPGTSVRLQ
jgi:hypothetical protein